MTNALFQPAQLRALCAHYGLAPSKRYGQHYLIAKSVVENILGAADIKKSETVVEIGPGFGVLTLALALRAKNVVAFEIEKKLQPYWQEQQKKHPNIEIVWGNALKAFAVRSARFAGTYKVVANLPYQITSRALRTVLEAEHAPERVVVMVQKEVAERIVAKPGDMSLLSVSVQYFGTPHIAARVPKGNFWPEPKVDSAVVVIDTARHSQTGSEEDFFRVVRAGFANKRKQLWKNISTGLGQPPDKTKRLLAAIAQNEKVRAEELHIDQWKRIVEELT